LSIVRLPASLIDRLVLEMQLSSCAACQAVISEQTLRPVPLNRGPYLLLILRCDKRFHFSASGHGGREGISVSAIAASFGQPFETARRHVNELIESGFCERRGLRVRIRQAQFDNPSFVRMLNELHDIMVRLVAQLFEAGVPLPDERRRLGYDRNATIAASIDLVLAAYEYAAPYYASWLQMRVLSAISFLNGTAIAADPALTDLYALDELPPDDLMAPASASAVARLLGLSEATARRQVRAAMEAGMVVRRGTGLIVPRTYRASPDASAVRRHAVQRGLKAVERMAPSGFRFTHPSGNYVEGPPAPVMAGRRPLRLVPQAAIS